MADAEHLKLLQQGVAIWNEERPDKVDLSEANLSGTNLTKANFCNANLTNANLTLTNLTEVDFSQANLIGVDFRGSEIIGGTFIKTKLSQTKLRGCDFSQIDFRESDIVGADLTRTHLNEAILIKVNLTEANLTGANLTGANLTGSNLTGANLTGANLTGTNLSKTELRKATLINANLTESNLREAILIEANLQGSKLIEAQFIATQVLYTNFSNTKLTGACIKDWNINTNTIFDNVICDYIYLLPGKIERRPASLNENFAPGDFARLVQKFRETVDLIFHNGVQWETFIPSFHKLNQEAKVKINCDKGPLFIRSIENREDGSSIIRVDIPPELDKNEIEKSFKQEAYYLEKLNAKDEQIQLYREYKTDFKELFAILANKPININNMPSNGDTVIQSGQFGIGQMSGGEIKDQAKIAGVLNEAQQDNINMIKVEIEQILQPLLEQYPRETEQQQELVKKLALAEIAQKPDLMKKLKNAAKEGSLAALEQSLDHPVCSFIINAVKGWQEA